MILRLFASATHHDLRVTRTRGCAWKRDVHVYVYPTLYCCRKCSHTKELIQKTPNLNNSHFLIRLLYKDCYRY